MVNQPPNSLEEIKRTERLTFKLDVQYINVKRSI